MIKLLFGVLDFIMKHIFIIICLFLISSCGFKSDDAYLQSRIDSPHTNCDGLLISQSTGYNGTTQNTNKQFYRVQTEDNKNGYHSEVSQNFLNNSNYMNRITASQNIQKKSCQDQYFKDVRFFDSQGK